MDEVDAAARRKQVGAKAREKLDALEALLQQGEILIGAPEALRERASELADALIEAQVAQRLRATSLNELRGVVGKGVRFGKLEAAGYRTVADVRSKPVSSLLAVQGVGENSAKAIATAAAQVARQFRQDAVIRFDVAQRPGRDTKLLGSLVKLRAAEQAAKRLRPDVERLRDEAAPLLVEARRAGSKFRMFFAGKAAKNAALAALRRIEALLAGPGVAALRREIASAETAVAAAGSRADEVWRSYENSAADINSLLATLSGARRADDTEAAHGYASSDLTRKIQAVPLDTSHLTATLRGYQVFGAQYAITQQRVILGDEMGLGKTVQALAAAAHLAANGQTLFLVVCPASVLVNWINEIDKHTVLKAQQLYGSGRDAAAETWARQGGVAVTTYTTLGRLRLPKVRLSMVIVDEAHYVKNPEAQRSQAVLAVVRQAERALFLTGTPMENRVEEFRNLVGYLQPGVAAKVRPLDALGGARAFRRAVAPVYLRRNQEDVLRELPERLEMDDWVQFTDADERNYRRAVSSGNYMAMRRAAFAGGKGRSAKLERLLEIVEESAASGWKVIVFSYFLDVLDCVLDAVRPVAFGPLTGSSTPRQKQDLVDSFSRHDGHAVLLSQVEAGGVGLNIQAASVVIIAEPQWKPSTEEQAIARAHRMGQLRKVHVHRLMAKDSVDERIREILEGKTRLFDAYARKSSAKESDARAVDTDWHSEEAAKHQIIEGERRRLGLGRVQD
ncbi:helicase SNF2 [Actinosynnema sp. ALI-1.44]|uniref:DEAD/DEAH box helicase n=1 Tax=Actinosynnema sp. ALI-1.44 TaxID=1933779 RepID=UPI00097CABE2|nr:DEAD/DEAH box helicase [Actinosynnema sp. ALI-1.44]ONI70910.1 helicase SNF2 [Actinosynnema sp. ALI-1.44]